MRDMILLRAFLTLHMPICGGAQTKRKLKKKTKLNPAQVENNIEAR